MKTNLIKIKSAGQTINIIDGKKTKNSNKTIS